MLSWFFKPSGPPFDDAWRDLLQRNVWHYRALAPGPRERVHEVVGAMVAGKHWEGGSGLVVTDEMRVTISGVAALMTLGLDAPFFFPKLKTVIVYESGYRQPLRSKAGILETHGDPIFGGGPTLPESRLGEAWQWGPVVLSWRDVLRSASAPGKGDNLVLHEFAHHLDGLDGAMDGAPMMPDPEEQHRWYEVTDDEYHRLVGQARRREVTLLDHYGASNRAEFFAVSTECFFERPQEMRERHAHLFELLGEFYRQDPTEWVPRHAADRRPSTRRRKGGPIQVDLRGLGLHGADASFARGCELMSHGEYEAAEEAFTEAIRHAPDDAEALAQRAEARLALGDERLALGDALRALELDPQDDDARLLAADAFLTLDMPGEAAPLVKRALGNDRKSAYAWTLQGWVDLAEGRPKRAQRAAREALRLEPLSADAHDLMAEVLEDLGQSDEAAKHRRRAEQLGPGEH